MPKCMTLSQHANQKKLNRILLSDFFNLDAVAISDFSKYLCRNKHTKEKNNKQITKTFVQKFKEIKE